MSARFRAFTISLTEIQIPNNIQEALRSPEWRKAIEEKIQPLEKNGTWEITDMTKGKRTVGSKAGNFLHDTK